MKPTETPPGEISVTINGEPRRVAPGLTVTGLLQHLSLPAERVAIECNRKILPRDRFGTTAIEAGDCLEIVQFVGGG